MHNMYLSKYAFHLTLWKWHSLNSGPATRDPGPWDPGTLRPRTLSPWDHGLWNPGPGDSGTLTPRNLEIGPWDLEIATQNPESRTLIIKLVTQIPSILTRTTDWINFNCEANFDNIKLGHLSQKLDLGAGVDGPKHLPKYFDIWHNTKKLENI